MFTVLSVAGLVASPKVMSRRAEGWLLSSTQAAMFGATAGLAYAVLRLLLRP
jgi:hypothetical protein